MKYYAYYSIKPNIIHFVCGTYGSQWNNEGRKENDSIEDMKKVLTNYAADFLMKNVDRYNFLEYFTEEDVPSTLLNQHYNDV